MTRDYLIKRNFGRFLTFKENEIRKFTEEEANQISPLIDIIEETSNIDKKPDKMYRKGRKK